MPPGTPPATEEKIPLGPPPPVTAKQVRRVIALVVDDLALTFEDIVRYGLWYEKTHACTVRFFIPNDEFSLKRRVFRRLCGERMYLTLFCSSVWIHMQKKST